MHVALRHAEPPCPVQRPTAAGGAPKRSQPSSGAPDVGADAPQADLGSAAAPWPTRRATAAVTHRRLLTCTARVVGHARARSSRATSERWCFVVPHPLPPRAEPSRRRPGQPASADELAAAGRRASWSAPVVAAVVVTGAGGGRRRRGGGRLRRWPGRGRWWCGPAVGRGRRARARVGARRGPGRSCWPGAAPAGEVTCRRRRRSDGRVGGGVLREPRRHELAPDLRREGAADTWTPADVVIGSLSR